MAKGESPKIILAAMASADRGREDKEAMDQSKKGRFEVDPELGLEDLLLVLGLPSITLCLQAHPEPFMFKVSVL